jgi:hypothetical protein
VATSEGRNRFSGNTEGEFGNQRHGNKPTEFQPETNMQLISDYWLLAKAKSQLPKDPEHDF